MVAGLIGWCGDFDLAEEGAADAFEAAVVAWRRDGPPERPLAWLTTVARNRVRDRLRRRTTELAKLAILEATPTDEVAGPDGFPDERLRLIFTCCHPALPMPARVALTLRTLCGLTSAEIGRAFLVTGPTMEKRLVRARAKVRDGRIPYRVPPPQLLPERLNGVLAVLYLMFNEGYAASSGDSLVRTDITAEAVRLARLLHRLLPDDEVTGLLALMLLTDARRAARMRDGEVVRLAEQDRTRWDRAQITEGATLLAGLDGRPVGAYQAQARIALEHDSAATPEATDWAGVAALYGLLPATPVTQLNQAVAISMVDGPAAALAHIEPLTDSLSGYHLYPATRADFLARLGRVQEAITALDQAIALAPTGPERRLLVRRRGELRNGPQ
ncbi:RNA polymerase subunit sigma-24 [Leekyejoonella antrihumi]|uniref:RNA polymerase subunit sigma-24 n=1 Tax=Leekyejoonella antrihumi TaxID=1660198 RepID=A0A563E6A7_9MICO|nr:RNA polymerase subunit sigma-24 [Leekyejoonella antrihumi]